MPSITDQAQNVGERIAAQTCILEIHVRQPGFRKKMNSATFLAKSGNNAGISSDVLTVAKDLLEKRDLSYLETHRNDFLRKLKGYSVYGGGLTLGNGQYLMPLSKVEEITAIVHQYQAARETRLDRFENSYAELKEKAKGKLGEFYNDNEYPPFSEIRKRYTIDYKWISNSVPEELKKLSDRIGQEESRRRRAEMDKLAGELKTIMRQSYLELITHLSDKLGRDDKTGKFNTLPESRVKDLLEFIEAFNSKNVIGDTNLAGLVEKAKLALGSSGMRELNSNAELRDQVVTKISEIKQEVEDLTKPVARSIDLSKIK